MFTRLFHNGEHQREDIILIFFINKLIMLLKYLRRSIATTLLFRSPEGRSLSAPQLEAISKFPWQNSALLKEYGLQERVAEEQLRAKPWNEFAVQTEVVGGSKKITSYMKTLLKNRESIDDFNVLYREFHQWCAVPDYEGITHL